MNIIFYIWLLFRGIPLNRRFRIIIDGLGSVRYGLKLLTLFTIYCIVRSVVFMMQARRYKAIMEAAEEFMVKAMAIQIMDNSSSNYGGFKCPDLLVCEPWTAVNTFTTMTVLFFNSNSHYYHSSELFQRMKLALRFIAKSQYEDGTLDTYFSGEMRSASNVAFIMHPMIKAYKLFHREAVNGDMLSLIETFLRKGVGALKSKPVLTPNQRWVAASALVEFDKLFLDHAAVIKAENYLSDSIDINHDGLYSDRSPTKSMVSNAMLLNIAKKLNRTYLMEYVRRNLNFSLYNFCYNGEVVTEYSLTPESESGMPQGYGVWKEMSIIDHNGYYASAGDMVLDTFLCNLKDGLTRYYINNPDPDFRKEGSSRFFITSSIGELLLLEDEFDNDGVHRLPLPNNYKRVFPESNIVRIKNGRTGTTIIGDNNILLSLHNGKAIIDGFRIKYMYYGYRDFMPKKLEVAARSYILRDWFNYYESGPTPNRVEPIDVDLRILTEFVPRENGLDIEIYTSGQEGVPLQLEFAVRKQGTLIMNGSEYDLCNTHLVPMYGDEVIIQKDEDQLLICGGIVQHKIYSDDDRWTSNLGITRLIMSPLTPFTGKIQIVYS
jgi:hypothetical protein